MSRRIYIGPHVVVRFRNEVEGIRVQSCANASCPRHGVASSSHFETDFCGKCGSKIAEVESTRPKKLDPKYVVSRDGGLFEILREDDGVFIGCYHRDGSSRDFVAPDVNEGALDLTLVDPDAEMRWFSETHAIDVIALDGAYDDVRVRWGLVVWREAEW